MNNAALPALTSVGANYNLRGNVAYQISPHWFAGGIPERQQLAQLCVRVGGILDPLHVPCAAIHRYFADRNVSLRGVPSVHCSLDSYKIGD